MKSKSAVAWGWGGKEEDCEGPQRNFEVMEMICIFIVVAVSWCTTNLTKLYDFKYSLFYINLPQ